VSELEMGDISIAVGGEVRGCGEFDDKLLDIRMSFAV